MSERSSRTRSWMPLVFLAAIAVPIIAGILLGGPMLGFAVAALVAIVIVGVAVRQEPRGWRGAAPRAPADHGWHRSAALRFLLPLAMAVVGIVLIVGWAGVVRIIGWGVIGIAITLALSLVFLEVGYSEDRARARERPPRVNRPRRA